MGGQANEHLDATVVSSMTIIQPVVTIGVAQLVIAATAPPHLGLTTPGQATAKKQNQPKSAQ